MTENAELHVILGAGAAGLAVMDALHRRGQRVRLVNRSGSAPEPLPDGVEIRGADLTDAPTVRDVCAGASAVYQCLGLPYPLWEHFPPLQTAVLDGVAGTDAKLIVLDNLYAYGESDDHMFCEDMPYNAHTRKGKIRARMAEAVMDAHAARRLRATIGRASDFFGPRALNSAMGERVFYPALAGKAAQLIGNLSMPHSLSYMRDVGEGLAVLGERDEALGEVWHLPNADPITLGGFVELVYAEAGHEVRVMTAPRLLLQIMGLFNPIMREQIEMLYEFEQPFIVDHSKFARAFGDTSTPLEDAIRETLAWFRANPQT